MSTRDGPRGHKRKRGRVPTRSGGLPRAGTLWNYFPSTTSSLRALLIVSLWSVGPLPRGRVLVRGS